MISLILYASIFLKALTVKTLIAIQGIHIGRNMIFKKRKEPKKKKETRSNVEDHENDNGIIGMRSLSSTSTISSLGTFYIRLL